MEYTFPELTPEENADIREARTLGWAVFYPAFPDGKAQAQNTLQGARDFLDKKLPEIGRRLVEDFSFDPPPYGIFDD
jgi:hypothetical protein